MIGKRYKEDFNYPILGVTLIIIVMGVLTIKSATASQETSFYLRQIVWALAGFVAMATVLVIDYSSLDRWAYVILGINLVFLVIVEFAGVTAGGSRRWINFSFFSFQPSELLKPLSVLIVAWWMVRHSEAWTRRQDSIPKLFTLAGILLVPLAMVLKEPDFGTSFLVLCVSMLLVFLGGAPRWIFAVAVPALGAVGAAFVWFEPYRRARVLSFLNPAADPLGKGHQALQSLIALGNGGLAGVGLGGSMQKLHYLPEAHTDFIYAVIAEEAGLIGTVAVLALYVGIIWRGYRIARRVGDGYLKLCAMGFMLLLVAQALMNMSVVLSLAPNKGIPLPFISFGPNSLIASLICLGLLLSISKDVSA